MSDNTDATKDMEDSNAHSINIPVFDGSVFIKMNTSGNQYNNKRVQWWHGRSKKRRRANRKLQETSLVWDNTPMPSTSTSTNSNKKTRNINPVIVVQGGAGDIPDSRVEAKLNGVKKAAVEGYSKLIGDNPSVLDAVVAAVMVMENDEAFNAGYGSCLNLDGEVEMEASIQRGSDLEAGSVTLIKNVLNPIVLARKVMEDSPHCMLGAEGAFRFAVKQGLPVVDAKSLVTQSATDALKLVTQPNQDGGSELGHAATRVMEGSTVGAVAIDHSGNIAVATSTGGRTGKYVGRIGDTPIIGSGTYADNCYGGSSTTGHGESILKTCLAHSIIKLLQSGFTAQKATETAITNMTMRTMKTAGAITISKTGGIGVHFNSPRMAWCYVKNQRLHFGINRLQHHTLTFQEYSFNKQN